MLRLELQGKTEYGKKQVKKHGSKWIVLEVIDEKMFIVNSTGKEYKWVKIPPENYEVQYDKHGKT